MRIFLLYLMAILYIVAGINHFWHPQLYLRIIPHFLPYHDAINTASGIAEILIVVLLFPKITRSIAAWALVFLLVIIFPANIQMAVDYAKENHPQTWAAYLRLPLQALLVWWALLYTNWYQRRKKRAVLFLPVKTKFGS
jgi:uncharacterized membrane protein